MLHEISCFVGPRYDSTVYNNHTKDYSCNVETHVDMAPDRRANWLEMR